MPIDPSIALGYRGITAPNPLNQLAQVSQIQSAQQANQLNQMKIAEAKRALADENALREATKGLDLTTTEGQDAYGQALLKLGNIAEFQKYKTAIATQSEAERKARTAQLTNAATKGKLYNDALTNISDPQGVIAWYTQQAADPDMQGLPVYGMKPEDIQKEVLMNSVKKQQDGSLVFDQNAFNNYKQSLQLGLKEHLDVLDKQAQRAETERAHRASEDIERDKLKLLQDKANKGDTTADAGKELLTSQVISLRDTYDALSEKGGIVDTKAPWYKNLGAWVSSTGPGQTVGKALGTDTQSLRNTIAQSRPLLLNAIKQATGMTAKQMDSNVELQMYLKAATDPTADIQSNRKALQKLNDLFGLGIDLGPIESSATPAPALSGAGMGAGAQMSPQDQAALDWANKNPKDPRAAKIKAKLGVK